jgi:DNA-binding transcriptional LysR family regulator
MNKPLPIYEIYSMELRHIRYFLAVAEEGSFTRAAARLGIGQPPLSLQIRDLEKEVGVALFKRVPHGAELTDAGSAFRESVAPLPARAAEAAASARRAAAGHTGQLSLGFTGTAALNPAIPAAIRSFRRAYPDVELRIEEANSIALVNALMNKRLDVAFIRPSGEDPSDLMIQSLLDELLVAALPASHPHAHGRGTLALSALRDDSFILTPREVAVSLHDSVLDACRNAGFTPRMGQPAPQIVSILSLVSAELGVSLIPTSVRQLAVTGVVYRKLQAPGSSVQLAVAHRREQTNSAALNFVAIASGTLSDPDNGQSRQQ